MHPGDGGQQTRVLAVDVLAPQPLVQGGPQAQQPVAPSGNLKVDMALNLIEL